MTIREADSNDVNGIWEIFEVVVTAGDTFAFDPGTSKEEMIKLWFAPAMRTYVAEEKGQIIGSYFIKPNQPGLGRHIANCGYIVHPEVRGKGIGALMCAHSLVKAKEMGYKGMQYNLVVSTNTKAVELWERSGFKIIGTIPRGFNHKKLGYVDAYIMFREIS